MAVRKTVDDTFVVCGTREQWLPRFVDAFANAGFTEIHVNEVFGQIRGDYRKLTVWGNIEISLMPEGENTKVVARATANVDNVYALFSSPGKKIIDAFKSNVTR